MSGGMGGMFGGMGGGGRGSGSGSGSGGMSGGMGGMFGGMGGGGSGSGSGSGGMSGGMGGMFGGMGGMPGGDMGGGSICIPSACPYVYDDFFFKSLRTDTGWRTAQDIERIKSICKYVSPPNQAYDVYPSSCPSGGNSQQQL